MRKIVKSRTQKTAHSGNVPQDKGGERSVVEHPISLGAHAPELSVPVDSRAVDSLPEAIAVRSLKSKRGENGKNNRRSRKLLIGVGAGVVAAGVTAAIAVPAALSADKRPVATTSASAETEPGSAVPERAYSAGELDPTLPVYAKYTPGTNLSKADVEVLLHNIDIAVTNTNPDTDTYDYDTLQFSGITGGSLARNLLQGDDGSAAAYYYSLNRDIAGGFTQKVYDDGISIQTSAPAVDGTPTYVATAYISAAADFTRQNYGKPSFYKEDLNIGVTTVENKMSGTTETIYVVNSIQNASPITIDQWNKGIN